MAAIDEFQRELIVEGTIEGLAAARASPPVPQARSTGHRFAALAPLLRASLRTEVAVNGDHAVRAVGRSASGTSGTTARTPNEKEHGGRDMGLLRTRAGPRR
jgi:hypothetical protein